MLVAEEQKTAESEREIQRLQSECHIASADSRRLSEQVSQLEARIQDMQTASNEHQKKYNNVKAVLFKLRDKE